VHVIAQTLMSRPPCTIGRSHHLGASLVGRRARNSTACAAGCAARQCTQKDMAAAVDSGVPTRKLIACSRYPIRRMAFAASRHAMMHPPGHCFSYWHAFK